MAEPTLSLSYDDIVAELGFYVGWTRTPANWSVPQAAQLDAMLQTGYRRFLTAYDWSFLRPVTSLSVWADLTITSGITVTGVYAAPISTITASAAAFYPTMVGRNITITTVAGTFLISTYTSATVIKVTGDATCAAKTFSLTSYGLFGMPDDFGQAEGDFTFEPSAGYPAIPIVGESQIRAMRQKGETTGRPRYIAIRPRAVAATGQRYDAYAWPTPDTTYVLSYRKRIGLAKLATTNYPSGGVTHSETVLECCLAVAEERMNGAPGLHAGAAQARLAESIRLEAQMGPETLGYCGDTSDGTVIPTQQTQYVRYNGVLY